MHIQWNINDGTAVNTIEKAHDLSISSLLCAPSGDLIISGGRDYAVKIWDTATMKCTQQYSAPRNIVTCMELDSNNSNIVYQGSEDLCIRVWDRRAPRNVPAALLTGFVYFPLCLSTHADLPTLLAVGCKGVDGQGGEVRLYDIRGGGSKLPVSELLIEYRGHQHDVTACRLIPSSSTILSVSKDGYAHSWDYATYPTENTASEAQKYRPPAASVNALGCYMTCMSTPFISAISEKDSMCAYVGAFDGSVSVLEYRYGVADNKLHRHELNMSELSRPFFARD